MKQLDTLQKSGKLRTARNRWWLWTFMLLAVLAGTASGYAQDKVSWNQTALASNPLTVLTDTDLNIDFTPTQNLTTATVEVTLPTGVSYKDASLSAGGNNAAALPTASWDNGSGKLTLTYTATVSTRSHLKVSVQAACGTADGKISIKVLTGSTQAGARDVDFTVQTPVIRGTTTIGSGTGLLEKPAVGNVGDFTLSLSTTNGEVKGAVITLSYKKGLVLSDVQFNGLAPASVSIEETKATITLADTDILGVTAKNLTFKAKADRCGIYTITPSAAFGCATYTDELTNLTLAYPTIPGTPAMKYWESETEFVKTDLISSLATNEVPMDGKTVSYFKLVYENVGSADAHDIVVELNAWRNVEGKYNYIAVDGTNLIKYSVDGGTTITALASADYTLSSTLASNTRRQVKSTMTSKNTKVEVRIPATLAKNQKLVIYYPVAGGDIYDNSAYMKNTLENNSVSSINWFSYSIAANNACEEKGSVPTATHGKAGYPYPRISGSVSETSIPAGGSKEITFPFYAGDNSLGRSIDIVVELPEWLELEDTPANSIKFNTNTPTASDSKGANTYYARYANSGSGAVTVKYKTKSDLSAYTTNQEGKIRVWVDWNMNDLASTTLKYFTQVFQDVNLIIDPKGITLDEFKLIRDTRGLKDITPHNNIPDDGTNALEDEIDHTRYLERDNGHLLVKASIPAGESSTYSRMYLLVSSSLLNISGTHLGFTAGTLQKNTESSETVTLTRVSDKEYYLEYIPSTPLQAGDHLVINVPFTVGTTVIEQTNGISVEAYVTNALPANIFTPTVAERNGEDILSFPFGSYSTRFSFTYRGTALPFEGNTAREYYFHRMNTLTDTPMPSPYFNQEVRNMVTFKGYTIEMPTGYVIADGGKIQVRKSSSNFKELTPSTPPVTAANGITTYTYDLSSIFSDAYTDGNVVSGTWAVPAENFSSGIYANVQATKFAQPNSSIKTTVTYDNKVTGEVDLSASINNAVVYSGPRINLSTNGITSIDAVSSDLLISPISVGNPNTSTINNVWLYIGGNVNNIKLLETDGTVLKSGAGFEGRWLEVDAAMASGFNKSYGISFTYTGSGASDVELYIVSGFGDSWAPTIANDIASQNSDYTSTPLLVGIKGASSRVDGSLSVESGYILAHNSAYTLTASLNSESSVGVLKEPTMTLKVPAKQKYILGSAEVEYPKGSGFNTNAALDALFAAAYDKTENALPATTTDFTLDLSGIVASLPGFNGTTDANNLVVTVKAQFSPQCGTPVDGMRYTATLGGKDFSDAAALGSGRTVISRQLLPDVVSAYTFAVTTAFKENNVLGRTSFNENITSNTLYVDIKKEGTATLSANNRLRVELPDVFTVGNVNDNITVNGDLFSGDKTVIIENIETGTDTKVYYITLPTTDYAVAGNGDGKTVRFAIPLSYTSADAHKDNPELDFNVSVVTQFTFGSCPGTSYAPIGIPTEGKVAVLRATAASYNATIDEDASLEIVSDNFGGAWYKADKTTQLSAANPYSFNGENEGYAVGAQTLYVSAIFGGVDYGMVSVPVTIYPSLDYTLTQPAAGCSSVIYTVAQFEALLSDTQSTGVTYKFYKRNTAGVLSDEVTTTQTINTTTSYWVESNNTFQKGIPREIIFTINSPVVLDPITAAINLEGTTSTPVSVNVASGTADSNGEFTYQLYEKVSGIQIGTDQTTPSFTISQAALLPTEASKTYTYYILVQGAASCPATQSDDIVVNLYPTPTLQVDGTKQTAFCSTDLTLAGGISIESYIQDLNTTWFDYTYNINGAAYTALTSATVLPKTAGTYTINLKAVNKLNGSTQDATGSFSITVTDPVLLAPITTPVNVEATAATGTVNGNITATTAANSGTANTYRLFEKGTSDTQVNGDQTTGVFNFTIPVPTNTAVASESHTYYVSAIGAASCTPAQSNDVVINVYPFPVITAASGMTTDFCSTDPTLTGGISLDSYINATSVNTVWFDYSYSTDGGTTYLPLTASVKLATTAGSYNYTIRAKNKLAGSTQEATILVSIVVTDPVLLAPITTPVNLEGADNAAINAALAAGSGAATSYKLYDKTTGTASQVGGTQGNGNFSVAHTAMTDISVAYESYTYYITAQGVTSCTAAQSNDVEVRVYPVPALTLSALPTAYCETDPALLGGIDLFDYIDNANTTWFTYTYTGGGVTDGALTAGAVTIPTAVGTYSYTLKAVNTLTGSTLSATQTISIKIDQKTEISNVTGYEVTEGDAVTFVATATGDASATLDYAWFEDVNGSWIPLSAGPSNTFTAIQSANLNDNGKKYRLEVTAQGSSCSVATADFTLIVKARMNPPLGNNKVTWTVIGYGNVSVTADGYSISNGSHVNNGANLVITANTWKSNVLKSITINGTNYNSSPASYTANGADISIVVEFLGSDPNPDDPSGNAEIEDGSRIWSEGGYAYIYTETATRVRIVTFNGRLVTDQKLSAGESRIQLPDGYYIVTLNDGTTTKIAVRNF